MPYNNALLRTTYLDSNKEIIFFRNDVAVGWSAIQNDTPVGEGGKGGLCPSQNLVDMYDMIDGSSPFTTYDATGAPVYNNGQPTINTGSGYSDATMWTGRDKRLEATVLYHGTEWGNGTINVIKGQRDNPVGNANATPTGYYVRRITSYNVCYTKLLRVNAAQGGELITVEAQATPSAFEQDVVRGTVWHQQEGWTGNANGWAYTRFDNPLKGKTLEDGLSRITSYNVCYTKLLRSCFIHWYQVMMTFG